MSRIRNHNQNINRYESRALHQAKLDSVLNGEGLFVFRNNTSGTLDLPKATVSGQKRIPRNGEWQGDNYYMVLVKRNEARCVRTILTPEQTMESKKMAEQKLILDQPDQITEAGKVEHVVQKPQIKLNESTPDVKKTGDILINEDPMSGIDILVG